MAFRPVWWWSESIWVQPGKIDPHLFEGVVERGHYQTIHICEVVKVVNYLLDR